jgi:hypothetical protein
MYNIHHLYVSSSDDGKWGPDLLGEDVLRPGGAFTVTAIRTGEYDVKFVDQDGDECTLRRIKILENTAWELTTNWLLRCEGYLRHGRHRLVIQNDSRYDVHRIHLSSSDSNSWGRDVLGATVLTSGSRHTITNIPTGRYDIKFVDEDGDQCVLKSFAVARDLAWTLTTDWLLKCEGYTRRRSVR